MLVKRYVSYEEIAFLALTGKINSQTCPFAVIGAEEKNPDTDPQPVAGTVMFFVGDTETPYDPEGYYEVLCELDNLTFHQGLYRVWSEDYDGNHYISYVIHTQEVSCPEYGLANVVGVRFPKYTDLALLKICDERSLGIWEVEKVLQEEWLESHPYASPQFRCLVPSQQFSSDFWGDVEGRQEVYAILAKYYIQPLDSAPSDV